MNFYVATGYRWGWTNNGSLTLYVGDDQEAACNAACAENTTSGGKYGCSVVRHPDEQRVAYYPSGRGEESPYVNYRIEMFGSFGSAVHSEMDSRDDIPAWLEDLLEAEQQNVAMIHGIDAVAGKPSKLLGLLKHDEPDAPKNSSPRPASAVE